MNEWSASGMRPAKMPTTQATMTTRLTASDHSAQKMKWGIARIRRKKTVSRFRSRSSLTTRWIGCGLGTSTAETVSDMGGLPSVRCL
jgi:hypothetical protein